MLSSPPRMTTGKTSRPTLPIDAHTRQNRAGRADEDDDAWVDGSEPDDDAYDEDAHSRPKLSKADRKRLRKQRRQCA